MKFKKIGAAMLAAAFLFSTSAATVDAARGGARISAPKVSAPKASAPKASTKTEAPATKTGPNQNEYAPSKKASDYKETAPAARSNTNANVANNAAAANTGSRWGNTLRNVGLLAGGMMLGSMLGSMFGFGSGVIADILGVLMNVALGVMLIAGIMMLVRRFFGKKNTEDNTYSTARQWGNDTNTVEHEATQIRDIKRDSGYDAKSTADKYRRM